MSGHPLNRAYRDVRAGAFMHPLGANRAYDLVGDTALGRALELPSNTAPAFAAGEVSSRPRLVLALLCVAQFVVVLDVTIVNVALPSVRSDLGLADSTAPWVISAYAVVFAAALLTGGRAADVFGRRETFVVGLALFTLCSLLAGLAWELVRR